MISAILIDGPRRSLERAIKEQDWFEGIVMGGIWLERLGYLRLKKLAQTQSVPLLKKPVYKIGLFEIMKTLHNDNILNDTQYDIVESFIEQRNNAVHQKETTRAFIGPEAQKEYEPIIINVLKIVDYLM